MLQLREAEAEAEAASYPCLLEAVMENQGQCHQKSKGHLVITFDPFGLQKAATYQNLANEISGCLVVFSRGSGQC